MWRLVVVLAFVAGCAGFFLYMWSQSGGNVPGLSQQRQYGVTVYIDDVDNMVAYSDVQVAGVPVGKVARLDHQGGKARLDLQLDGSVSPLHEGATVQVSEKSLAGQPVLNLVDGTGAPYKDGAVLPPTAVKPSVQLRDVLASLDKPTRDALSATVRSLGQGTAGSAGDVSALMTGLGNLGRGGNTALDAIAAQTGDLKALAAELNTVFNALDTGQGQIADVVSDANRLTSATAGQAQSLGDTMTKLPGVLDSATTATGKLNQLAGALAPVAADLKTAAPDLSSALEELPATTADLRGLLPSLDATLNKAPATLQGVPAVGRDVSGLAGPADDVLRDLNPMLRYLQPYGKDIAQLFQNFGSSFHHYADDGGAYVIFRPVVGPYSLRPNPLPLDNGSSGLLRQSNPYPAPGGLQDPSLFQGQYPHVERDPK
ncbi:hypothetical protein GCM10017788_60700 [Amycolatopsis acidiphila]|nr:hypothetical protein GCM10017788_60700 [Amycolatopsis acidiphila]